VPDPEPHAAEVVVSKPAAVVCTQCPTARPDADRLVAASSPLTPILPVQSFVVSAVVRVGGFVPLVRANWAQVPDTPLIVVALLDP
jgi:hypothetical protein